MENKQQWELNLNTGGDPSKSMLILNGEYILTSEVSVIVSGDKPAFLNIQIPIVDGNLIIKMDTTKPVDREVIVATAKE